MPKINPPLTDTAIRALKPKDKVYKKSDGQNLFIFIEPGGRKFFALEYKSPLTLKTRRMALGNYPDLSLSAAREKRRELAAQILDGIDPLVNKKSSKTTLNDIAAKWLDIKSANITPNYLKKQNLIFNKHVAPYLGDRPLDYIKAVEIIDILKIIEKAGNLETIKRVFILLNQIFRYAVTYEIIAHNVMADINFKYAFKTAKPKNFPTITDENEIRTLLASVDGYNGDIKTKVALKLVIYTAVRPFNVRAAQWDELDLSAKIWTIKADKMKMKEAFRLPLADQVVNLLKDYTKICGSTEGFLFPSTLSKSRPMSENTLNTALRRMGYSKDEIVSHGFRAMFSTMANEKRNEHGCHADIIERCLAHKDKDKVREAYNRAQNLADMKTLMQWWADYLDELVK